MVKNLENKENTSQLDPSKAWIRNIGTGSTRRSPKKWINRNRSVSEAKPMAPTTQTQQCKVRQRLAEFYQSRANERTQTAQQNSTVIELDDSDPKPSVNASQSLFVEESVTVDETVEYESTSTAQNKSKQNLTAQQNGTVIVLDDSDPKPGLNMSQSLFVEETVIVDETIDVSESTIVKAKMGTIAEASNDQTMNKTVVVRTEPTKPAKALPFFEVSTDISSIFEPSSSSSAESTVMPLSSTFASTTCIRMQNVATELRKLQISNDDESVQSNDEDLTMTPSYTQFLAGKSKQDGRQASLKTLSVKKDQNILSMCSDEFVQPVYLREQDVNLLFNNGYIHFRDGKLVGYLKPEHEK